MISMSLVYRIIICIMPLSPSEIQQLVAAYWRTFGIRGKSLHEGIWAMPGGPVGWN